jgi:surface polysaccharide O-acyltransferase-like enzyme
MTIVHTPESALPASLPRYHFLDWVRIIAFFLLILYHVGMVYVTWGWHVKSPYASDTLEPYMMLSAPWRLSLLFLVSGVASSAMLAKLRPLIFLRKRSWRLLVPLLFGMLVIVPPQSYVEVVEKLGYADSYAGFMRLYLRGYHGFCQDGCLILPTWNHLWFVVYLWVYTAVLALVMLAAGPRFDRLAVRLAAVLSTVLAGWRLVVLPAALLALARILMLERFPITHALIDDWYSHAQYLSVFLLGALMARMPAIWPRAAALRWTCLALALTGWATLTLWYCVPGGAVAGTRWELLNYPMRAMPAMLTWCAIVAACGFAQRHLDRDGPARRYLTEAMFPLYILHQTLIVVLAHALKPLHRPPGLEALLLVVLVTVLSFAGFEIVRRVAPLRPLFGLGPRPRIATPATAVTATAAARAGAGPA